MRHWAPHVAAKEAPPNDRCKQMLALHCKAELPRHVARGGGRTRAFHPGAQHADRGGAGLRSLEAGHGGVFTARPRCVSLGPALDTRRGLVLCSTQDESWFCQFLGVPLTQLVPLAREGRVCACGRHVIDEFGDHIHSCKKHTGSTKAAHETLLDALEALCFQAGIKTERCNIPSVTKPNGKIGWGDLVLKNVNLAGTATSSRGHG